MISASSPPAVAKHGASAWYGWQTLAADLTSAGILGVGLLSWTVEPTVIGYASFVLATPIDHVVNGNIGRGIGSLAIRVFVPVLGGAIGGVVGAITRADGFNSLARLTSLNGSDAKSVATTAGIGAAVGAGICTVVDAAVFAYATRSAPSTGAAAPRTARSIAPIVAVGRTSTFGVGGTF